MGKHTRPTDETEEQEEAKTEAQTEEEDLTAPMDLDGDPTVVPIKIKWRDGTEKEYTMEEMYGPAREAYLTASSKRVKMSGGNVNIAGMSFDGMHAELLTRCMYTTGEDRKRIDVAEMSKWPGNVIAKLYKRAQAINGLDAGAKERLKNA